MPVTWRVTFAAWLGRRAGSRTLRPPEKGVARPVPALADEAAGSSVAELISEADLHGYIDGEPATTRTADLEAFLAAHPLIAERVEAYRSHIVAVNAAFRGGDDTLPPGLAELASRYAHAVAGSSRMWAALGILGLIVILCVMTAQAHGG